MSGGLSQCAHADILEGYPDHDSWSGYFFYSKGHLRGVAFYVLRPILACRWILDKGTPPPMRFEELMDSQLPDYLKETVKNLLDLKMNSPEVKEIPRIDILNGYLDESIDEVKALVEQYPREVVKDWDELNRLFLRALEM